MVKDGEKYAVERIEGGHTVVETVQTGASPDEAISKTTIALQEFWNDSRRVMEPVVYKFNFDNVVNSGNNRVNREWKVTAYLFLTDKSENKERKSNHVFHKVKETTIYSKTITWENGVGEYIKAIMKFRNDLFNDRVAFDSSHVYLLAYFRALTRSEIAFEAK